MSTISKEVTAQVQAEVHGKKQQIIMAIKNHWILMLLKTQSTVSQYKSNNFLTELKNKCGFALHQYKDPIVDAGMQSWERS